MKSSFRIKKSYKMGYLEILIGLILEFLFFPIFCLILSLYFGFIAMVLFLFGRKIGLGNKFGKFYVRSIEKWPEIKGCRIYPFQFLLIIFSLAFFPWQEIFFWLAVPLVYFLVTSFTGRDFLKEVEG